MPCSDQPVEHTRQMDEHELRQIILQVAPEVLGHRQTASLKARLSRTDRPQLLQVPSRQSCPHTTPLLATS